MNKEYRFYFHYYRQYKCLSVHFKGVCYKVKDIKCLVPVRSKWNATMPNLVMQGFATEINIENGVAEIK